MINRKFILHNKGVYYRKALNENESLRGVFQSTENAYVHIPLFRKVPTFLGIKINNVDIYELAAVSTAVEDNFGIDTSDVIFWKLDSADMFMIENYHSAWIESSSDTGGGGGGGGDGGGGGGQQPRDVYEC